MASPAPAAVKYVFSPFHEDAYVYRKYAPIATGPKVGIMFMPKPLLSCTIALTEIARAPSSAEGESRADQQVDDVCCGHVVAYSVMMGRATAAFRFIKRMNAPALGFLWFRRS